MFWTVIAEIFFIALAGRCLAKEPPSKSNLAAGQESSRETEIQVSLTEYCPQTFQETGLCPEDVCTLDCVYAGSSEVCRMQCQPKSCFNIEAEHCPLLDCRLLMGCEEKDVCFPKAEMVEPEGCGDLGYFGPVECCEGYAKRCGVEFLDGSCDMVGAHSEFSVPICLPCGNGICNQFENSCSCPEDCE